MLKRIVAIVATAAAAAVLITPPAQASPPDQLDGYAAGSSATALAINLVDQQLAFSSTTAAVSSEGPTAAADGASLLVAGTPVPSGAPSQTPGGAATNEICSAAADAGDLTGGAADGVGLDLACVETAAKVDAGAPDSSSQSGELVISLDGLTGSALGPLMAAISDALDTVLTPATETSLCGDGGILVPIPGLCDTANDLVNVDALVDEILADLGGIDDGTVTVARIHVAPTLSTAGASAEDGVVAKAGSTGVDIELFPGLASSIEELTGLIPDADADQALAKISLSNATAQVVRDPVTGAPAPDASAAQLLDVHVTDSLGILNELLEVQVPGLVDTLAEAGAALSCDGGALAPLICIDLGAVNELDAAELEARGYDYGEGTVGREASAAHIEVLQVVGNLVGGESVLSVDLSEASAAANAIPAAPAAPVAEQPQPLPRTGGDANIPLALGLFAAAAVGLTAIRRTRTT